MKCAAIIITTEHLSEEYAYSPVSELGKDAGIFSLVGTLKMAGISDIEVVLGYKTEPMQRRLEFMGVQVSRNYVFEAEGPYSSYTIGMKLFKPNSDYDAVLFIPSDCESFTARELNHMLRSEGSYFCRQKQDGAFAYPILIKKEKLSSLPEGDAETSLLDLCVKQML